jgi:ubiquinone/menaquinone biosynthesis C-methylase UbiE
MTANAEQIALWNGPGGERRARQPHVTDAQVRLHNERLRGIAAVMPGEHVLDIGCGTGQTTREAARAAAPGKALGVDLSASMLAVARRLSAEEGLGNVSFEQVDAQVHRFEPGRFDVAISRFGVMFFDDMVAAFGNIGRALRPGGRLVLLTWQAPERNEWALLFREALTGRPEMPALPATGHGFTLAEPVTVKEILGAAGFTGISLTDVHQPVFYGPDADVACELARTLSANAEILAGLDETEAARALGRLRDALAAHQTGEGVSLDARTWIITARRS